MSHSTVLVVIRDAENAADAFIKLPELLAPFDENEVVTPYENELDEDDVERVLRSYAKDYDPDPEWGKPDTQEFTRRAVGDFYVGDPDKGVAHDDGTFGYLSTYNPRSRWDWWQLGGRWHGFFLVKPGVSVGGEPEPEWRKRLPKIGDDRIEGATTVPVYTEEHHAILGLGGTFGDEVTENFQGRADLVRKGDVDFDAMATLAGQEAEAAYDQYEEVTKGLTPAPRWQDHMKLTLIEHNIDPELSLHQLEELGLREAHEQAINEARRTYAEFPWVQALTKANMTSFLGENRDHWCVDDGGRETFVRRARISALETFAVLLDGEWYERGEMGWWGMASNEKDDSVWQQEFSKLLDGLPDDVWLAVCDVHI